jgi:hypothetical protein
MTTELTSTNNSGTDAATTAACEQLAQVLRDYYKGIEDLKDYQAKIARAEADQESAISSQTLSDEEIAQEIAKLIALKALIVTRMERKQTDLARFSSQLEKLYQPAVRQFSDLMSVELDKRQALITARVTEALEIASDLTTFEAVSFPVGIADLTQYSAPVRAISSLRPSTYWGTPGDGAAISSAASVLLANLKKFNDLLTSDEKPS